jgi:hypothetical protein
MIVNTRSVLFLVTISPYLESTTERGGDVRNEAGYKNDKNDKNDNDDDNTD